MIDELKWSDDDIRQLREALNHLLEINEELNAKIIAMDAYVKNGDAKIRLLKGYIQNLETIIINYENEKANNYNCPN
jgi:hypothetical protein